MRTPKVEILKSRYWFWVLGIEFWALGSNSDNFLIIRCVRQEVPVYTKYSSGQRRIPNFVVGKTGSKYGLPVAVLYEILRKYVENFYLCCGRSGIKIRSARGGYTEKAVFILSMAQSMSFFVMTSGGANRMV
ncbi:hypothetical protein SAMN02746065_11768 [Desulfocicer vacuolatum DSM 3385]|uniref:Uncharacterized protein n=1 Tax=Desulfocicer vacuolatum DSM 3385 TaxID=1121400 RepID=A0A1W2DGA4_9BACT|nr:hypothetical protein SAMN02746065_11768 [Desulfocicer vacuolatum DSM 3385]